MVGTPGGGGEGHPSSSVEGVLSRVSPDAASLVVKLCGANCVAICGVIDSSNKVAWSVIVGGGMFRAADK